MHCVRVVGEDPSTLCDNRNWTEQETDRLLKRKGMEGTVLGGLQPISVSFPITLTLCNMQVSQVIMNALPDAWPFSHLLLCPALCFSVFSCLHCSVCTQCTPPQLLSVSLHAILFPCISVACHYAIFSSSFPHWNNDIRCWSIHSRHRFCQVHMNKSERLFLLDHLVSTLNTRLDELITFRAQRPPLQGGL